jgi:TnpA family transposase
LPTRELLPPSLRAQFTEIPTTISLRDIARYYTLSVDDLKIINRRRRSHNRLGFAVQLCYLRFPGRPFSSGEQIPEPVLSYIASQLSVDPSVIAEYGREREPTRSEHLREIEKAFGFRHFNVSTYKEITKWLLPIALSTDKGMALVTAVIEEMRVRKIIIPALSTVERLAWEVRRRAQKLVFKQLTDRLTDTQRRQLDGLLVRQLDKQRTDLVWLRQSPGPPTPNNFNKVVERLEFIRSLKLDPQWRQQIHQNRLIDLSRTGAKYTPPHLARLDDLRRYATLVAFLLDTSETLVDQAIDMHDRMMNLSH